jgi:hypothetical protein
MTKDETDKALMKQDNCYHFICGDCYYIDKTNTRCSLREHIHYTISSGIPFTEATVSYIKRQHKLKLLKELNKL